jgi:hypothetical protein
MTDAEDANGIPILVEPDAVFSNPEAILGQIDALELLDVAFAGHSRAVNGGSDAQTRGPIETGQVGPGPIR